MPPRRREPALPARRPGGNVLPGCAQVPPVGLGPAARHSESRSQLIPSVLIRPRVGMTTSCWRCSTSTPLRSAPSTVPTTGVVISGCRAILSPAAHPHHMARGISCVGAERQLGCAAPAVPTQSGTRCGSCRRRVGSGWRTVMAGCCCTTPHSRCASHQEPCATFHPF